MILLLSALITNRNPFRPFSSIEKLVSFFKELESSNSDLMLTSHMNTDPDGLGAVVGMWHLLSTLLPSRRYFFWLPSLSALSIRLLHGLGLMDLVEKHSFRHSAPESSGGDTIKLDADLLICDTHNTNLIPAMQTNASQPSPMTVANTIFFVDHHIKTDYSTPSETTLQRIKGSKEVFLIDHSFKASSEFVLQLICLCDIDLPLSVIKLLFLGILTDSRRLSLADASLLSLISHMLNKRPEINLSHLHEFLEAEFTRSEQIARLKSAQRMILHTTAKITYAITHVSSFEAAAARGLISLGADVAFAISETNEETRVSIRGKNGSLERLGLHLGELAGIIAGKFEGATGSGHLGAAGVNIPHRVPWNEVRRVLEELMIARFPQEL